MAYIIKTTGEFVEVQPKNGTDFQLEELKATIGGGYIEIVRPAIAANLYMIVDEEGKLKNLPPNIPATVIYGSSDVIAGDVLLCLQNQIL